MNKMKFNICLGLGILLIIFSGIKSFAQQEPMYTQYNFNTQTINPAYAGTWNSMGFVVLARNQWAGMDGAPKTYTLSLQTTNRSKKVGLGLNVISDNIGKEKRLSLFGDYSYRLEVARYSYLRLGLKFGATNYSHNLSLYEQYPGEVDPISQGEVDMSFMPNFGIGAFLYSEEYFVGFSVPKLLTNKIDNEYTNYSSEAEFRHFFLMAGYVYDISRYLKFKPTLLTKATVGAPVEFDFSANFLLNEKIWLGAMYRTSSSFGFIAQFIHDKKLRFGYGFDFTVNELQKFNNGTHEIMVSYELGKKGRWASPRMF